MSVKCKMKNVKAGNGERGTENGLRFAAFALILHFTFYILHSVPAHAETVKTASQPWVTNEVARAVAPLATTNQLAAAVAAKADAKKTVSINTGGASTNLVVKPVYANVNLVIRECETANGNRQYRLIRKEEQ